MRRSLLGASFQEGADLLAPGGMHDAASPVQRQEAGSGGAAHRPASVREVAAIVALGTGYRSLAESRKNVVRTIEAQATDIPERDPSIDVLTSLVSSLASAMTGGISKVVSGLFKDEALKFVTEKVLGAVGAAGMKIADSVVSTAINGATTPEAKRRLFFIALEHEVEREVAQAEFAFLDEVYQSGRVPQTSPEIVSQVFNIARGAAEALQYDETRRAWLVYQAQHRLGTSPRAGTPIGAAAKRGGTRLGVDGSAGVNGVLQVELAADDITRIVRASLPGLGGINAIDMGTRPLRDLRIPIRFAVEGTLGETRYGIFVNEAGMAVAQGHVLEQYLYTLGGGPRRQEPGEVVDPKDRVFVERGLPVLVAKLMSQRLGGRLEQ